MGWISRLGFSDEAETDNPWVEAVINDIADDPRKTIRSDTDSLPAPRNCRDARIAEEIKRRQLSLAVRYVWVARAC